tara:strand:+ start:1312 stop:1614 length:303 start_codon:yes stop_codon:yes gene_type:complete
MNGYSLYAVSGDCSAQGMSNKAEVISLRKKDMPLVGKYLRNQLEKSLISVDIESAFDCAKPDFVAVVDEHNKLGNAMIEKGIFSHKWHKRTEWILIEDDD